METFAIDVRHEDSQLQYGIGVPNGEVAKTAIEAEDIAKRIGMIVHGR